MTMQRCCIRVMTSKKGGMRDEPWPWRILCSAQEEHLFISVETEAIVGVSAQLVIITVQCRLTDPKNTAILSVNIMPILAIKRKNGKLSKTRGQFERAHPPINAGHAPSRCSHMKIAESTIPSRLGIGRATSLKDYGALRSVNEKMD